MIPCQYVNTRLLLQFWGAGVSTPERDGALLAHLLFPFPEFFDGSFG